MYLIITQDLHFIGSEIALRNTSFNCLMSLWPWTEVKVTESCRNRQSSVCTTIMQSFFFGDICSIFFLIPMLRFLSWLARWTVQHSFFTGVKRGCSSVVRALEFKSEDPGFDPLVGQGGSESTLVQTCLCLTPPTYVRHVPKWCAC